MKQLLLTTATTACYCCRRCLLHRTIWFNFIWKEGFGISTGDAVVPSFPTCVFFICLRSGPLNQDSTKTLPSGSSRLWYHTHAATCSPSNWVRFIFYLLYPIVYYNSIVYSTVHGYINYYINHKAAIILVVYEFIRGSTPALGFKSQNRPCFVLLFLLLSHITSCKTCRVRGHTKVLKP